MKWNSGRLAVTAFLAAFLLGTSNAHAQRYLADYDSLLFMRDTVRPVISRFNNIFISGYIQPQFQVASSKGTPSYSGGNFPEFVNNRFMLRRARLRVDYNLPSAETHLSLAVFTFQFEATERDVNVRDMLVRVYEPRHNKLSLAAGLFARPFGYEVNLSSSYRETPERGRMSQILMPSERDLGAAVTYESRSKNKKTVQIRYDLGLFNGQGKSGPAEFDSFKDLITRFTLKPCALGGGVAVSGGLSFLFGGWVQPTQYRYEMGTDAGNKVFVVDSSLSNIGKKAERMYYGADIQLRKSHSWGKTELRAEYWRGTQPGTKTATVNPGTIPTGPVYIRSFDGAFLYFLQNIVNRHWELMAKYDWYDPNTKVSAKDIGKAGTNFSVGDIRFHTFGTGLTYYFNDNLKALAYYEWARNENTSLPGFTGDVSDNVFTFRMQLRF
jgi:hypothetical protein